MSELPCRFCRAPLDHTVCDLGMSPLSNKFVEADDLHAMERFYPLHVYVCRACFLVQLAEFETAAGIFDDDYAYFSSYSESWLEHARAYVQMMMERFGFGPSSQVVEVASNDGYLLQYFRERGVPVLGIEPAANVAAAAEAIGVPTRVCFFGVETARALVADGCAADLLLGNNVLAHVPDLNDFVAGLKIALKPGGVMTLEFPHLLQLLTHNHFDTMYHEHFSYLSLLAVERIFAHHGVVLFDAEELCTHGGSLRIFARHAENDACPVTGRPAAIRARETAAGLDRMETYTAFQDRVHAAKRDLLRFLIRAREEGKTVAGYGAPAKGNTLLNYCGVRTDLLAYTVDRSPRKQGRYLPGVHIPVYPPERVWETRPDYLLILPWNIKEEIMEQMAGIREWGGRFAVPIPRVEVWP